MDRRMDRRMDQKIIIILFIFCGLQLSSSEIFGARQQDGRKKGFLTKLKCWIFGCDPPPPPPTITCPGLSPNIFSADEGETEAVVSWSVPTSPDGTVKQSGSLNPGQSFGEGSYSVTYYATSNSGNSNPCTISFTVEVNRCDRPTAPKNGRVECESNPPIYGHSCSFECAEGYIGQGSSYRKCQKDGSFNGTEFSCDRVSCGEPHEPVSANVSCPNGYVYTSICEFPCHDGYKREENLGSAVCEANGTWSPAKVADCKDAVPPEIHNCPASFTSYVGADQVHAVIEYTLPYATDTIDGTVDVVLTEGFAPGTSVAIDRDNPENNQHSIIYTAIDSGGLPATLPCHFIVVVADLTCEPLPSQPKMNTTCSEPLYIYNSKCDFTCFSGYPLEGLQSVTCEKYPDRNEVYWNWGEGNEPTKCIVQDCPDLEPPLNGAMGCVLVSSGKHCTMSCNDKFDIPRTAPALGSFFCDDAVGWLDGDEAPDCTEIRRPNRYNLPVEFYYSGDCNSDDVLEKIKQHVITTTLDSKYKSLCERSEDCTVENVNVTCGEITQKKMQTTTIIVTFEFSVAYTYDSQLSINEQFKKLEDAVYNMFDIFVSDMENGLLNLVELNLVADSSTLAAGSDDFVCPFGLTPEYTTLTCSSCPIGTMYDADIDNCMKCSIGTYQDQDAQTSCKLCPDGFSTAFTGSKHEYDCKEMCPPGSVSEYGIIPCYLCGIGTYQELYGQKSCTSCPAGTNSTIAGSSSLLSCKSENLICLEGNICGEHGICVPDLNTEEDYQCVCVEGYTGDDCSTPPNPCQSHACQNQATCLPEGIDYTCTCMPGYTGKYCQHQIINGGWSDFGDWSLCSQSCGVATQTRTRYCDSPEAQNGGLDCIGEAVEIQDCEFIPCPACSTPLKPYKGAVDHTVVDGIHTATLSCPDDGRVLSGTPTEYTCSSETNFIWEPFMRRKNLPKCIEISLAESLSIRGKFEYRGIPSTGTATKDAITEVTEEALMNTPCVVSNVCRVGVLVTEVSNQRKRRDSLFTFVVDTILDATLDYEPYFVDGILQAVNETLPEYEALIAELEELFNNLETAVGDGSLGILVDGQVYLPSPESYTANGNLSCPAGRQSYYQFCATCPPGTMEVSGECVFCGLGTYQDVDGKTSCIACPNGQTTEETGSNSVDFCIPMTESTTDGTVMKSTSVRILDDPDVPKDIDEEPEKDSNQLVYLSFLAIIPVILIGVLILYCCKQGGKVDDGKITDQGQDQFYNPYHSKAMGSESTLPAPPDYYSINPM